MAEIKLDAYLITDTEITKSRWRHGEGNTDTSLRSTGECLYCVLGAGQ